MEAPIVSVRGISKKYAIGKPIAQQKKEGILEKLLLPYRLFRGMGMPFMTSGEKEFWALRDINFDLYRGERLGIIGRNGAGKTTLLKILSRLVTPTEGEARIRGRITSLLEVGTGFNANMTGRENIYLDATLHGLTRSEIRDKFDEIVEFSGIGKFIDTPMKYYSSGMYSRLAFAVAAHLDPDILMLDEVLSVGDMAFQQKCLKKVQGLTSGGRTLLFVSHSLGSIMQFCNRVIWLNEGIIKYIGGAVEGCELYQAELFPETSSNEIKQISDREGTGIFKFHNFFITDSNGNLCQSVCTGQNVDFVIEYEQVEDFHEEIRDVCVAITVVNEINARLISMRSEVIDVDLRSLRKRGRFICHIRKFPLVPDVYFVNISLQVNRQLMDKVKKAIRITVLEGDFYGTGKLPLKVYAPVCIDFDWEVK